jgi:hypothetical protein
MGRLPCAVAYDGHLSSGLGKSRGPRSHEGCYSTVPYPRPRVVVDDTQVSLHVIDLHGSHNEVPTTHAQRMSPY